MTSIDGVFPLLVLMLTTVFACGVAADHEVRAPRRGKDASR